MVRKNYYIVVKGGKNSQSLGSPNDYRDLKKKRDILYEGASSVIANKIYRNENKGYNVFDKDHKTHIFSSDEIKDKPKNDDIFWIRKV